MASLQNGLNQKIKADALFKRIRKANKLAKQLAHGGFGEEAKEIYINKYGDKPLRR